MAAPAPTRATTACVSDDELAGYVAGELAAGLAQRIADHVDACADCRRLVSALARAQAEVPANDAALAAGQPLGRFTLLRPLGRGAMGEVWAARDPELDREVALKLLHVRPAALGTDPSARLRREAQAMARLDHPNVVAIYELGTDGDRVFCAMRLVDGVTLGTWLATPRRWRDVLAVALDAGRGLAAAHAAGLVHRDIKPENILIARDGRALVTDFGLAKLVDPRSFANEPTVPGVGRARVGAGAGNGAGSERNGDAAGGAGSGDKAFAGAGGGNATGAGDLALDDTGMLAVAQTIAEAASLTRTGAVIGTPAYMPPEQLAGDRVDATSDQFSFCVTIYEALFGVRPFAAQSLAGLAAAIQRGPRKPPDLRGVPGSVVRCLRRGLAVDRAARWPSLAVLLDELERAMRRRRRWVVIAAAAALAAVAGGAIAVRDDPSERTRLLAERRISAVWNPERAMLLRAAFHATGTGVADERADGTVRAFDRYRADWIRLRLDAWDATHVRGEQTAELLERRLACFDRLADELGDIAALLARATAADVDRAPQLAYRLEPVASCAQIDRLLAASPAPSSPAGKLAERGLRELEALEIAGRQDEALTRATALVAAAEQLGDPSLLARARYNLGAAQANSGKLEPAEATLRLGVQEAATARDHYLVAECWLRLYQLVSIELNRPANATQIEPAVAAAVAQAGNDPRQLGDLAMTRGIAATARGDFADARDYFLESRERQLAAHGPDHPSVANADANLGAALYQLGELDDAVRVLDRASDVIRRLAGPHHPVIARAEQNLAAIAAKRKDWPASEQHGRAALAINLIVRGPDHQETAKNRIYLARALREQHRFAEARAELDRARVSLARSLPSNHPDVISLDLRYAQVAEVEGRWADAERLARHAVDGLHATKAAALPLAFALSELARMVAHRSPGDALAFYDEALTLDAPRNGRDAASDADTLTEVAHVALAAGKPAFALGWFDRIPGGAARLPALRAELEHARGVDP